MTPSPHITSMHFAESLWVSYQVGPEDEDEEDGAAADIDAQRKGKCVVLKTSTRQTIFLPVCCTVHLDQHSSDHTFVCARACACAE